MGNGHGQPGDTRLARSRMSKPRKLDSDELSQEVIRAYEKAGKVIRMLLLGAGESGKSTVLNQMRLTYGRGFSEDHRRERKPLICFNVIEGAASVINSMGVLNLAFTEPDAQVAADLVMKEFRKYEPLKALSINPALADAVNTVVADANFKLALRQSSRFQIQDGWIEFAKNMRKYPEWAGENWLPSDEDILLSRVRTTGISSEHFRVKDRIFQMIDVGGQRSERKKWATVFTGVHGVIFVSSLSEYDQTLYEDQATPRLADSIQLWDNTCNLETFQNSAMLLFLNKMDLFVQKYYYGKKVPLPLVENFRKPPNCEQEADEKCELAIAWFKDLFTSRVRPEKRFVVFTHVTTAVDPVSMRDVIKQCAYYITVNILGETGLAGLGV